MLPIKPEGYPDTSHTRRAWSWNICKLITRKITDIQLRDMLRQNCIKEAMRMHPGVQYPLERFVPKGGVELGGHFIPEGTIVGMNPAVIHRDKEVFGNDADEFRPSRWTEDGKSGDLKEMERSLLTVSQHLSTQLEYSLLTISSVRSRSTHLYRQKY